MRKTFDSNYSSLDLNQRTFDSQIQAFADFTFDKKVKGEEKEEQNRSQSYDYGKSVDQAFNKIDK